MEASIPQRAAFFKIKEVGEGSKGQKDHKTQSIQILLFFAICEDGPESLLKTGAGVIFKSRSSLGKG